MFANPSPGKKVCSFGFYKQSTTFMKSGISTPALFPTFSVIKQLFKVHKNVRQNVQFLTKFAIFSSLVPKLSDCNFHFHCHLNPISRKI